MFDGGGSIDPPCSLSSQYAASVSVILMIHTDFPETHLFSIKPSPMIKQKISMTKIQKSNFLLNHTKRTPGRNEDLSPSLFSFLASSSNAVKASKGCHPILLGCLCSHQIGPSFIQFPHPRSGRGSLGLTELSSIAIKVHLPTWHTLCSSRIFDMTWNHSRSFIPPPISLIDA
jgi:hypothetical protein